MRVWTHRPRRLCLDLPDRIHINRTLTCRATVDGQVAPGVVITLRQGGAWRQQRSDAAGMAHFDLHGLQPGPLAATAVHPQCAALNLALELLGPSWLDVTVKSVLTRFEGGATAVVLTPQGERELAVPSGATELLGLLVRAAAAELPLRVQVNETDTLVAAEWTGPPAKG